MKKEKFREKIWRWLLDDIVKHPANQILPKWLIAISWILFPLKRIRWYSQAGEGYQPETDSWIINGLHYPSVFFHVLRFKVKNDEDFRIKIERGCVLILSADRHENN